MTPAVSSPSLNGNNAYGVRGLQKYLITNVVYGKLYLKIFLEYHLRSILDETNLPAIAKNYDIEYRIFIDRDTIAEVIRLEPDEDVRKLGQDEIRSRLIPARLKQLAATVKLHFAILDWERDDQPRFNMRYSVLTQCFHESVRLALNENALLTAWVADLVVAREFFPRIMRRMEEGHGAVFVLPARAAYEPMAPLMDQMNRAIEAKQLFRMAYANLHPLWTACDWNSTRFTKLPFAMLWTTPTGIMARSYSVTPIVFKPKPEMLVERGMVDGDVPAKCDNPYWCENWTDAPVVGVEPLFCYYPPFLNIKASKQTVKAWSRNALHPTQIPFVKKRLYYPDKSTARIGLLMKLRSDAIARYLS